MKPTLIWSVIEGALFKRHIAVTDDLRHEEGGHRSDLFRCQNALESRHVSSSDGNLFNDTRVI